MEVLLVSYDLRRDQSSEHYERVASSIRACGTAVEVQRSVWLVHSDDGPREVMEAVAEELDAGDRLLVGAINKAAAHNPLEPVDRLLRATLGRTEP